MRERLFFVPSPPKPADKAKTTALAASTGAKAAESLRDLAQRCNAIITMLPNTPHVEAVYLGSINRSPPLVPQVDADGEDTASKREGAAQGGGLLDWVGKGTLLVDSSTIDPLTSRRVNVAAATRVRQYWGLATDLFSSNGVASAFVTERRVLHADRPNLYV